MPLKPEEVTGKLHAAFDRLVAEYREWGGHLHHGWTDYADPSNYLGPVIWSEADCVLRFCMELEREFPRQVHCELSIDKATRHDWALRPEAPPAGAKPGRQSVDIVVSDFTGFLGDANAQEALRHRKHEAFIEAKWLKKGWRDHGYKFEAPKRVKEIEQDLQKLAWHLRLERCLTAAVLVFDDEDFFDEHSAAIDWPDEVVRFIVGPAELKRRGFAARGAEK